MSSITCFSSVVEPDYISQRAFLFLHTHHMFFSIMRYVMERAGFFLLFNFNIVWDTK